jgi:hypothetical protein
LIDDVHVNIRCGAEEAPERIEIEILSPALNGGTAQNDLRDFVVAGKSTQCIRDVFVFEDDDFGIQILSKPGIAEKKMAVFIRLFLAGIHVDNVKLGSIHALGQPGPARNEVLRRRT